MKHEDPIPGCKYTIKASRDMGMCRWMRGYQGEECTVVRKTKAGLYEMRHPDGDTIILAKFQINTPPVESNEAS